MSKMWYYYFHWGDITRSYTFIHLNRCDWQVDTHVNMSLICQCMSLTNDTYPNMLVHIIDTLICVIHTLIHVNTHDWHIQSQATSHTKQDIIIQYPISISCLNSKSVTNLSCLAKWVFPDAYTIQTLGGNYAYISQTLVRCQSHNSSRVACLDDAWCVTVTLGLVRSDSHTTNMRQTKSHWPCGYQIQLLLGYSDTKTCLNVCYVWLAESISQGNKFLKFPQILGWIFLCLRLRTSVYTIGLYEVFVEL